MVIPIFGPFGIFWTAIAGWITYVNYKNGFTNEQIDSHVIEIEDDGRDVTVTKHGAYHDSRQNRSERGSIPSDFLRSKYPSAHDTPQKHGSQPP